MLALSVAGCATSYGDAANGFVSPAVEAAFIPLSGRSKLILKVRGAAVVFAPGIAVTNVHNDNIVDAADILGKSLQYDLMFFRTGRDRPLATGIPQAGEKVVAYGEGADGELRVSYGVISKLRAPVKPRCPDCVTQEAFIFEGNAGPGFSGGPVIDAENGRLLGITFGYVDGVDGARQMYAYDMTRVNAEFSALKPLLAGTAN